MRDRIDYDTAALALLLAGNQAGLAALKRHSEGKYPCPDCGDEGPHDVYDHGRGVVEAKCDCGALFEVPLVEVPVV